MSTTNGNGWKPRKTEPFTCPSGKIVQVRRPGPEFALRAGRVARTFSRQLTKEEREQKRQDIQGMSPEDRGLYELSKMSDEELAGVMIFARELVCAMMVSPRLVREPRPGSDEIGPDDIGEDFWPLFNYAMANFYGLKVPVGDGEVEVADLESFRDESGVSGDSDHGAEVQSDAEQSTGDRGLVAGA